MHLFHFHDMKLESHLREQRRYRKQRNCIEKPIVLKNVIISAWGFKFWQTCFTGVTGSWNYFPISIWLVWHLVSLLFLNRSMFWISLFKHVAGFALCIYFNWFVCSCITCEPDCTSSETSSGSHDLPSLAAADMMGLVNHISGLLQILQTHMHIVM